MQRPLATRPLPQRGCGIGAPQQNARPAQSASRPTSPGRAATLFVPHGGTGHGPGRQGALPCRPRKALLPQRRESGGVTYSAATATRENRGCCSGSRVCSCFDSPSGSSSGCCSRSHRGKPAAFGLCPSEAVGREDAPHEPHRVRLLRVAEPAPDPLPDLGDGQPAFAVPVRRRVREADDTIVAPDGSPGSAPAHARSRRRRRHKSIPGRESGVIVSQGNAPRRTPRRGDAATPQALPRRSGLGDAPPDSGCRPRPARAWTR